MLIGDLHDHHPPPSGVVLLARHDPEPWQVEQQRRSVAHRVASRLIA